MSNCFICGEEACICVKVSSPTKIRSTEHYIPPGITKDEFGAPLYEAIKICGGILQLQTMQQTADPTRLKDYQAREAIMLTQLAALTPKLPVADQEALIARYPGVFG